MSSALLAAAARRQPPGSALLRAAVRPLAPAATDSRVGTFSGLAAVWDRPNGNGWSLGRGAFSAFLATGEMPALLWQHDERSPIGVVSSVRESAEGLTFSAALNLDTALGREARSLLAQGAISGVSVGIKPIDREIRKGLPHITKAELWELSLVTFPAERTARVRQIARGLSASDRERLIRIRHAVRERRWAAEGALRTLGRS